MPSFSSFATRRRSAASRWATSSTGSPSPLGSPILVVAAVGCLLARLKLVEDPRALSRVATHALLPALAFSALARSELSGAHILALALCAWLVAALQSLLGWVLSRGLAFDAATTSAVLLCVVTVNAGAYGIPLNQFAFGPQAVGMATVYYVATLLVTYGGAVLVGAPTVKAHEVLPLNSVPSVASTCQ